MDFGKVPEKELKKIDFSLPPEPAGNKKVLSGRRGAAKGAATTAATNLVKPAAKTSAKPAAKTTAKPAAKTTAKPAAKTAVYIGCAKWGIKEWVGKIYPPKTSDKNFLEHYVKHYNSIELNATHYQVYGPKVISGWAEKAKGLDFKFCPKMAKNITHFGSLADKGPVTDRFLEGVIAFGEHLGPIFIQVSDKFSPQRKGELFEYLGTLPHDVQFFLEVRHPGWFESKEKKELFNTLHSLNIGAVITDTAGRRDCAHMHLTVPKAFIRFVGNSLHATDFPRCDEWVRRIKQWMDAGLQELYFFMHMHEEATSPELTVYLVDRLNEECGLELKKPEFLGGLKLF